MANRKGPLPQKSKGRVSTTTPSPANYVYHDSSKDSPERLRIQFLFSHLGMNGSRAALMSSLIWGVAA
jgi:hypothetical protein